MEQQANHEQTTPRMDFSGMRPVDITDYIDAVLGRASALAEIIEGNSLDGVTAFETIGKDGIAKLSWQIIENLKLAKEANGAMWDLARPYFHPGQN